MAALVVLEPIFEADVQLEQYAYRPGRSALEAVQQVQALMIAGHTGVVDADLSAYFDSIPHAALMTSVARRVSDRYLLGLIKAWLEMPVEETDARGHRQRTTRNRDEGRGTPQGAPLSPLLSTLYMRRFILGWKTLGHERRLDAHIVNYADDFVICCNGAADQAMAAMRNMLPRLGLTVNEAKTRLCRGPDERFDFLGYTIGTCYSPRTGWAYTGVKPSATKVRGLKRKLREQTARSWLWPDVNELVGRLNALSRGWATYFCLGTVTAAYNDVNAHAFTRLRRWLTRQFKLRGPQWARHADHRLHQTLGLLRLQCPSAQFSHGKVWVLVREPGAANPHAQFDDREVETGHGEILRHRQPKGPDTRKAPLHHRAISRLYPVAFSTLLLTPDACRWPSPRQRPTRIGPTPGPGCVGSGSAVKRKTPRTEKKAPGVCSPFSH